MFGGGCVSKRERRVTNNSMDGCACLARKPSASGGLLREEDDGSECCWGVRIEQILKVQYVRTCRFCFLPCKGSEGGGV